MSCHAAVCEYLRGTYQLGHMERHWPLDQLAGMVGNAVKSSVAAEMLVPGVTVNEVVRRQALKANGLSSR